MTDADDRPPENRSVTEIEADIEQHRSELEATVDELTDRLNPKTQLHDAALSASDAVTHAAHEVEAGLEQATVVATATIRTGRSSIAGFVNAHRGELAAVIFVLVAVEISIGRRRAK